MSLIFAISSYNCLKFPTQVVLQPLLFVLKGIPQVKYEKKPNDIACFFTFFTTLHMIWPKFCSNMAVQMAQIWKWNQNI